MSSVRYTCGSSRRRLILRGHGDIPDRRRVFQLLRNGGCGCGCLLGRGAALDDLGCGGDRFAFYIVERRDAEELSESCALERAVLGDSDRSGGGEANLKSGGLPDDEEKAHTREEVEHERAEARLEVVVARISANLKRSVS